MTRNSGVKILLRRRYWIPAFAGMTSLFSALRFLVSRFPGNDEAVFRFVVVGLPPRPRQCRSHIGSQPGPRESGARKVVDVARDSGVKTLLRRRYWIPAFAGMTSLFSALRFLVPRFPGNDEAVFCFVVVGLPPRPRQCRSHIGSQPGPREGGARQVVDVARDSGVKTLLRRRYWIPAFAGMTCLFSALRFLVSRFPGNDEAVFCFVVVGLPPRPRQCRSHIGSQLGPRESGARQVVDVARDSGVKILLRRRYWIPAFAGMTSLFSALRFLVSRFPGNDEAVFCFVVVGLPPRPRQCRSHIGSQPGPRQSGARQVVDLARLRREDIVAPSLLDSRLRGNDEFIFRFAVTEFPFSRD